MEGLTSRGSRECRLTVESAPNTNSHSFLDQRLGLGGKGWTRSGEVLGSESGWGKASLRFPLITTHKEILVEAPEEILCPRSQMKRPRHEGVYGSDADTGRAWWGRRVWVLDCPSLQGWHCTGVHNPGVRWQLVPEACQIKPLHRLESGLKKIPQCFRKLGLSSQHWHKRWNWSTILSQGKFMHEESWILHNLLFCLILYPH